MVLGKSHSPATTRASTVGHRRTTHARTATTPASAKAAPAKPVTHVKSPGKAAATATKPKTLTHVVPRHVGNKVFADLPAALQWQLSQHKIVVVSLYNPNS